MRPFHPIYALPVLGWMSQHGLVWAKLDSGAQLTRCAPTIIPGVDAATVDCVVQNNLDLLGDLGQLESDDSAVPKFEESDLDERDVQRSIHRRHASRVHKSGRRHHRTRMRKRQTKDDDEEDPKPKPKATPTSTTTTVAAKPKSTSKTSVTATTTTTSSKKGSKTTTAASTSSTSSESTKTTETSTASTTTESTSSASTTAAPPTSTSPKTTQTSSPTSPPAGVPIAGEGTGGVNAGVAAGSVFGGIAGVGLIFGGAFYYNRRRRNMQGANANGGAQKSSSHHLLSNIAKSGKGGSSIALIQQKGMPPLPNEHHTANSSKLDPMTEPQQEYSVVQGSRGGERHHTVAAPPTLHLPNIPRGSLSSIASSEFNYSNPPVKSRPTSSHDHLRNKDLGDSKIQNVPPISVTMTTTIPISTPADMDLVSNRQLGLHPALHIRREYMNLSQSHQQRWFATIYGALPFAFPTTEHIVHGSRNHNVRRMRRGD